MGNAVLFLHALTPLHTGTGQSVDVVDLPVAREKVTGWPHIPGSSIKGVFKDESKSMQYHKEAFGPDTNNASDSAGMLLFTDAKLLCFPVRSFQGVFAWVTCPSAVDRFRRDCETLDVDAPPVLGVPQGFSFEKAITCGNSDVRIGAGTGAKVILEEYDLDVVQQNADALANFIAKAVFQDATGQDHFKNRFVLVHDDMFSTLTETATEVVARIALDDNTKVVKRGALWYEEAVPGESIFVSLIINAQRNGVQGDIVKDHLIKQSLSPVQIGGNASVGRGLMRVILDGKELCGGQNDES